MWRYRAEGGRATAPAGTADAVLLAAPDAVRELKAHLACGNPEFRRDLEAAAAHRAHVDAFGTAEAIEGLAAFEEKRKPRCYPG